MQTGTKTIEETKFSELVGDTGVSLRIAKPKNGANYADSMKMLADDGLRALTYQEALPLLMKDEKLKNSLKGTWFWLAGQGMDKDGLFTITEEGELVKGKGSSVETTVRVWGGKQPLSLYVDSDDYAADFGRRFLLYANGRSGDAAPVVLGVPKETVLQAGQASDKTLAVIDAELRDTEKKLEEKKRRKAEDEKEISVLEERAKKLKVAKEALSPKEVLRKE